MVISESEKDKFKIILNWYRNFQPKNNFEPQLVDLLALIENNIYVCC